MEQEEKNEIQDENEYQPWYDYETEKYVESKVEILKDVVFFHVPNMKQHFLYPEDDKQYIKVEYFGYIDPDDVEYNRWDELRFNKVMTWLDKKNTTRVFFMNDRNGFSVAGGNLILPCIGRSYDWNEKPPKFIVTDGNHRIAAAKAKKFQGLMCKVSEIVIVKNEIDDAELEKFAIENLYK